MQIQLNEQIALAWEDFKEEGMRIEIFGFSGAGKCLRGDQEIFFYGRYEKLFKSKLYSFYHQKEKGDGFLEAVKRIDKNTLDISEGDWYGISLGFNNEGKKCFYKNKILAIHRRELNKNEKLLEISFKNGEIHCTADHILFTKEGEKPAKNIKKGDLLVSGELNRTKKKLVSFEEFLLGLYIAEGTYQKNWSPIISVCDERLLEYVIKGLDELNWNYSLSTKSRLRIMEPKFRKMVEGCGKSSKEKKIPEKYRSSWSILKGLLEGDGTIGKIRRKNKWNRLIGYSTISDELADNFSELLENFKIRYRRTRRKTFCNNKGCYSWRFAIKVASIYRILDSFDFHHSLKAKRQKRLLWYAFSKDYPYEISETTFEYQEVLDVKDSGFKRKQTRGFFVYDLTMEKDPNFMLANGVIVHNSHGIKVLIEEFLRHQIPFVAIDPEGEYASFKEVTDTVVLGGRFADLPLDCSIFKDVLALLTNKISLVFDLSEVVHRDECSRIATTIQERVFQAASQQKRLFVYVVDEARLIAPQQGKSKANQIAADIAQRGRKRGIIPIFGMQRPSEVDKSVLTQCNIHLMGKLQFPTDVNYVKDFLRDAEISEGDIKQLNQEFFLWIGGPGQKVKFRDKQVKDLGRTIQPGEEVHLEITSSVDLEQSIQQLQKMLEQRKQEEAHEKALMEQLKERIEVLETENTTLTKELEHEQEAVRVAKKLTFDVEGIGVSGSQNHVLESLQIQLNEVKVELTEARKKQFVVKIDGDLKEIPREVAKTIAFDEEFILPVQVWGIDLRDGKVLCDDTAFLLLNQLTFEERGLYFAMLNQELNQVGYSWSHLVDLIPGKGSKTIRPILNKLVRVGVVRTKKRGGYDVYIAKRIEVLQGAG